MTALLPRVKSRLFIHANRRSTHLLDGEYAAIATGQSLDFDDLRAYVPGDEVDDIDWKATARVGVPLVKRYLQTRRHDVLFAVDSGRGMAAAAEGGESKRDIVITVVGVLGYLSLRHGDSVGLVTKDGGRFLRRPPRASEGYLESLLRELQRGISFESDRSDIVGLVGHVATSLRGRSIVVIVGDDTEPDPETDDALRRIAARHEVLWITVADLDLVRGDGTGRMILDVDDASPIPSVLRSDRRLVQSYERRTAARIAAQDAYFRARGVSHTRIASSEAVVPQLLALLQRRRRAGT